MRSPGITVEGELRGQPANPGSPGKMDVGAGASDFDWNDLRPCQLDNSSIWSHLFCGAGHEKRRGEQLKWSWHLDCTLKVFHVHSYQDQFIQPGWAECVILCFNI